MNALDVLSKITTTKLIDANLKYCLVASNKHPYKDINIIAKPNDINDFVSIDELPFDNLENFAGIGISIQASNICAIDVDNCFSKANDITSADNRAINIMNIFKDYYYEFSFSGTGLRVLFYSDIIPNYSELYYIKNSNVDIEYYQPSDSFRYVTITGNAINNKDIVNINNDVLFSFLNLYMKRVIKEKKNLDDINTDKSLEQLLKLVKKLCLKNPSFRENWFSQAPGSGANESELDYSILSSLYENITHDKETLRIIFESSPYFKSKDKKHINKWLLNNYRYYNYVYEHLG